MIIYAPGQSPHNPVYEFYGGTERLTFVLEEWKYYRHMPDGSFDPQDGVTGVVKICTPSKALMVWAVKLALAKTKQLLTEYGCVGDHAVVLYESVLDDILAKAKKADDEALTMAGDIGTEAHDWLEKVIKTLIYDNESRRHELLATLPLDDRAANASIAGIEWMVRHNIRWICTERKCFSRKHGYAGTMDGLAWVDSCDDPSCCPVPFKNRKSVIDWKTSNALRVSYLFQAAAYRAAYQEETGEVVEDTWILRLDKETADFDPWHAEGDALFQEHFEGFLNCLRTCRSIDKAEGWVSEIQAGRTAARRAAEKEVHDAAYKIECPASKDYKGKKPKKGCNGTETVCAACTKKYEDNHK